MLSAIVEVDGVGVCCWVFAGVKELEPYSWALTLWCDKNKPAISTKLGIASFVNNFILILYIFNLEIPTGVNYCI